MQLFYSNTSPYARKVIMLAQATGLEDQIELIRTNPFDDLHRSINPLGKVPALVDDGLVLFDSPLICEYLNDKAVKLGRPDFLRRNEDGYFNVQRIHAQADGILDAAIAIVFEQRRESSQQSPFWIERWQLAIQTAVETLAIPSLGKAQKPHLGTIATAAALGYLDFRLSTYPWRTWNSALSLWFSEISERPWFINTIPRDN